MSNLALYYSGSNIIEMFFINAILKPNSVYGDNLKIQSSKLDQLEKLWTNDIANPIFDIDGNQTGYDKTISDLTLDGESVVICKTPRSEYQKLIRYREKIASLTGKQIESHVENTFSNFNIDQVKSLKKLYLAVWADVKISEMNIEY